LLRWKSGFRAIQATHPYRQALLTTDEDHVNGK
jgi:hypothetical protein